jgi:hypothetical protein
MFIVLGLEDLKPIKINSEKKINQIERINKFDRILKHKTTNTTNKTNKQKNKKHPHKQLQSFREKKP